MHWVFKMYLKIEGEPKLVKDIKTGAILNLNYHDEIAKIKKAKALKKMQENEITDLRAEVSEIKELLAMLIRKID